eukprot:1868974-Amphidinium_carterae.5
MDGFPHKFSSRRADVDAFIIAFPWSANSCIQPINSGVQETIVDSNQVARKLQDKKPRTTTNCGAKNSVNS